MDWVTARQLIKELKITSQTLYNWRKNKVIEYKHLNGKRYLYNKASIINREKSENRYNVIYCRVSTAKQRDDLIRQEEIIKDYCAHNGVRIEKVYKEIASGMNEDRKTFNELINDVFDGKIDTIYITYKDRLTRFGFNYFVNIFNKFNTKIEVINATTETTFENELIEDLISIIHHFSMKLYSKRRNQLKKIKRELEDFNENN